MLGEIGIDEAALGLYAKFKQKLNSSLLYDDSDLSAEIEDYFGQLLSSRSIGTNGRTNVNIPFVLGTLCDITCTQWATQEYPDKDTFSQTARNIWYSGCMRCCLSNECPPKQ